MAFEEALRAVGSDGIFQRTLCIFGAFACIIPLMQNLASIFTLETNPFTCDYGSNLTIENSCSHLVDGQLTTCPKYVFYPDKDGYSLRNHYLLICDKEDMGEFSNMFFFVGLAISGASGGVFADRFGRKPLGIISTSMMAIGGLLAPFMPQLWMYTLFRTLVGLGIPGLYNGIFTLMFETLDTDRRSTYYILTIQGWSSGVLFTALFGWLFPDFRHYELAMGLGTLIIVAVACILPESPRWLYTMGRKEESLQAINKIARFNREEPLTSDEYETFMKMDNANDRRASIAPKSLSQSGGVDEIGKEEEIKVHQSIKELFTHRYILLATVVTWFNWFSVSMCYYGWSLMVGDVGGDNKYLNLIIGGSIEIAGRFVIVYLANKVGRRPFAISLLWIVTFFAAAAAVLVLLGHEEDSVWLMLMGMFGRSFISWSWDILGLVMTEYAPTPVRALISGTTSSFSRIGSIVSSQFTVIGRWNRNGPHYVICLITFIAGLSCFIYPETQGLELSDSMPVADKYIKENFGCCRGNEDDKKNTKKIGKSFKELEKEDV